MPGTPAANPTYYEGGTYACEPEEILTTQPADWQEFLILTAKAITFFFTYPFTNHFRLIRLLGT